MYTHCCKTSWLLQHEQWLQTMGTRMCSSCWLALTCADVVTAGPICQLCAAKCLDSVQWAAACSAGRCHQAIPALPQGHTSWQTHPVQDQCEDLAVLVERQVASLVRRGCFCLAYGLAKLLLSKAPDCVLGAFHFLLMMMQIRHQWVSVQVCAQANDTFGEDCAINGCHVCTVLVLVCCLLTS